MADVDVVAIPAQTDYSTFDDLRLGRSSQDVVGRLLRFWDARNIKKTCSLIHCFIPAVRASQFRNVLQEGRIFCVGGFEVGRCTNLYKITDNPFVIRFLPSTTIVEVNHVGATIEREKFMLRKGNHLQALANINLELPAGNNYYMTNILHFSTNRSTIVYLSLWDDAAATFQAYLTSGDTINSVMLVTTINPKLFGGKNEVLRYIY
ncbi:hypothetical protein ARALYDRAFT_332991 [Arabidopsis lyrata subsp. lyrata]|uniref:DUF223 domain-containing protein n=1 Tax=Arabidopsis lyrata subsp. lyrata TaxID=81972 RepID=D7MV89_ARALL|nr:hypothetical protein ARALYDRAFT_332991 [Arabidopsis lyrata subsp. lyrata]